MVKEYAGLTPDSFFWNYPRSYQTCEPNVPENRPVCKYIADKRISKVAGSFELFCTPMTRNNLIQSPRPNFCFSEVETSPKWEVAFSFSSLPTFKQRHSRKKKEDVQPVSEKDEHNVSFYLKLGEGRHFRVVTLKNTDKS